MSSGRGKPVVTIALIEHFGDIVAAEPVLRRVRALHPDAHLIWVVRDRFRELVEHHPALDEIVTVGCLTEWMGLRPSRALGRLYDLHIHGRFCDRCVVPIDRRHDGDVAIHAENYYERGNLLHAFCRSAGLPVLNETPRLHLPEAVRRRVDDLELPGRFAVVHAKSNEAVREWTIAGWRELTARLIARGVDVVEIGIEPVIRSGHRSYHDLTGSLSLLETAEVIRRAAVFVGIDSGPAHLANAARTRGVILLGHYHHYRRYMPYSGAYARGDNATVLYADGPVAATRVSDVSAAIERALDCPPPRTEPREVPA